MQPQLSQADLRTGLSKARVRALDRTLEASLADNEIARIKVWNRAGRAVYSSDHAIIGKSFPPSDELRKALDMGAFDHVIKPIRIPVLRQRVRQAMEIL